MAIQFRRVATRLGFRENKPVVYKIRQLTYPPVKEKDLVKYAANAAAVPESTMQQCVEAIAQAIIYYAIRGMRVVIPQFGGFYLQFRAKTAETEKDCTIADTVKYTGLAFMPLSELRQLMTDAGETIVEEVYSNVADNTKPATNP